MTRFFSVMSRILRGRKSVGVVLSVGLSAAPGSLAGVKYGIPSAPMWAGEGAVARSVIVMVTFLKQDKRICVGPVEICLNCVGGNTGPCIYTAAAVV